MGRATTSFGGLVRAEVRERLQRRNFRGPAVCVAAAPFRHRLLLGGALIVTIGALSATQARGAVTPEPDPFPSRATAPTPTPDPHPSATSSAPKVLRAPEPAPTPSTPRVTAENESATIRSSTPEQRRTTPITRKQEPDSRANRPATKKQTRTAPPRAAPKKKTTSVAAPAVAAATASHSARPLALAGFALIALVLASCSLLYIVSRIDRWEARA